MTSQLGLIIHKSSLLTEAILRFLLCVSYNLFVFDFLQSPTSVEEVKTVFSRAFIYFAEDGE